MPRDVVDAQDRRAMLKRALGVGVSLPLIGSAAAAADDPKKARPGAGDQFVFFSGERKGEIIMVEDLPLGGPQILAYPKDPQTDTVRDGSRLNLVALIRLDEQEMSEETRANAAEGAVAYSAACTHQACPVSMWETDKSVLYCSCHGSQFDPKDNAKVVGGPAPQRLAMLPLTVDQGVLIAAGPFSGRVGVQKR
jgi:rieske iron-sulfur protein